MVLSGGVSFQLVLVGQFCIGADYDEPHTTGNVFCGGCESLYR